MASTSSKSKKDVLPEYFSINNYDYRIGSICDAVFPQNNKKKAKAKRTSLAKLFDDSNKSKKVTVEFLDPPTSKYDQMHAKQLKVSDDFAAAKNKEHVSKDANQQAEKQQNVTKTPSDSDERNDRTIFVGNLPLHCKSKDVKKLFSRYGNIESIRFRSIPVAESNMSKKTAFINNGIELLNRHIRVDVASNSKKHDHKRSIFVGNLPLDVQDESLRDHFHSCGEVETIRIIRDPKTGMGKVPTADVHLPNIYYLQSNESLIMALKLHGSAFNKTNNLRVFRSSKQPTSKKKTQGPFKFSGESSSKKHAQQAAKLRIKRKEKRKNLKKQKQDIKRNVKPKKTRLQSVHNKN
ncbi:RNA-binding protein 34 [Trichoplax sp. H2]|nr:RNA-binding protein 34 [Trichoplax sp. H2]|eukprot:RDD44937.1 RNA-binding protein 34 [Trichoplax sp. H2]